MYSIYMIDYTYKYLKYKTKNTNLMGGKQKVFDLDNENYKDIFKQEKLQLNLKILLKQFGNTFEVKYNDKVFRVNFKKIKLPSDIEFYRIYYDIPHRTTYLMPFIIDFIDMTTLEKNNNSYISEIHKTDLFSGSDMVKICLKINKILGVQKTSLSDGTRVICNKTNESMDLSFIKLLEKNKTFYMKLGFDYEITNTQFPYYRFSDKKKFVKELTKLLKKVRSIKTKDIIKEYNSTLDILNLAIKENYKNQFDIMLNNSNPVVYDEIYTVNPQNKVIDIIYECNEVLKILNKHKDEPLLYKLLIKLFTDNCDEYQILFRYIVDTGRTQIKYGNKIVKKDYVFDFYFLLTYRHSYSYSYTFY